MRSIQDIWLTRVLMAATVGSLTTGYTECAQFSTVTVPSKDYADPVAYIGRYEGGEHIGIAKQLVLKDVNDSTLLIGAGFDAGGVEDLKVSSITELHCCFSATQCYAFYEQIGTPKFLTLFDTQTDHQNGSTGSRVSNGMWLSKPVQPRSLIEENCPAGTDVRYSSVEVYFSVETEDFRWNEADNHVWVTYNSPKYAGTAPFYIFK